jgi:hypothetical protein
MARVIGFSKALQFDTYIVCLVSGEVGKSSRNCKRLAKQHARVHFCNASSVTSNSSVYHLCPCSASSARYPAWFLKSQLLCAHDGTDGLPLLYFGYVPSNILVAYVCKARRLQQHRELRLAL